MRPKQLLLSVILLSVTVIGLWFATYKIVQAQTQSYACGPEVRCGDPDAYCGSAGYQSSLPAINIHASGTGMCPQGVSATSAV